MTVYITCYGGQEIWGCYPVKQLIWYCLNHRLELAIGDDIEESNGVNHFKIFIVKLHSLYRVNPKFQREIDGISSELDSSQQGHAVFAVGKGMLFLGPY